jgi:hypothetical protein
MEPSVFKITIKRNKRKYGVTSTVAMTQVNNALLYTMENTYYATIKLQVLPNLLAPAYLQGKEVSHSIF